MHTKPRLEAASYWSDAAPAVAYVTHISGPATSVAGAAGPGTSAGIPTVTPANLGIIAAPMSVRVANVWSVAGLEARRGQLSEGSPAKGSLAVFDLHYLIGQIAGDQQLAVWRQRNMSRGNLPVGR